MQSRANRRRRSRVCVAAALLVVSTTLNAQTTVKPKAAEPRLDSSFFDPQPGWTLEQPSAGPDLPTKGVRTITIRPDAAPAPARPDRYYVQLTAQRTSREAQDRFDELQGRFPTALGSRRPVILRTEAGVSVVYRAVVGPFGDLGAATEMCDALKAQGGPCVVHTVDPEE